MKCIESTREQHRDTAGCRQRDGIHLVRILDMIRRQSTKIGGKPGATDIRELLGMKFYRQFELSGLIKHARHLRGVKSDSLTEPVHRIHKPFAMRRFKCGNTDRVDVVIGIHAPRHGMSSKKRGGDTNRPSAANRARHPQHLEFGL